MTGRSPSEAKRVVRKSETFRTWGGTALGEVQTKVMANTKRIEFDWFLSLVAGK